MLGAHVAGYPAFVVDVILRRYLDRYLPAMTLDERRQTLAMQALVHEAALLWRQVASAGGTAEAVPAEGPTGSEQHEVTTERAAVLLQVMGRRARQLAAEWECDGLARKVGRSWLLDRQAVLLRRQMRSTA